ncbi:MAG: Spy/CpxP family protein refolding chaperone [Gammaproteobacteria bacterium]|nr:Spy/CpxP family protein refolding chaperone [Gammaproteobacteria bacterium]MBU1625449.1 Spy/CpxP family protein refolding chaperone [Gammaproteobacteria bacterium]MBU1981709.1 Spy/CpxP family protein refolding chaperone [Gammaproteobacteria bacterium]
MSEQNTTDTNNEDKRGCNGTHDHHCHGRRGHCVARVIGLLAVFGIGFFSGQVMACERGMGHGGPQAFMSGGQMDTERMGKFAGKRIERMLDDVKASDAQKEKASAIVKASIETGAPLAEKMRDNHIQMRKLMAAPTLDKAAIEAMRAEQIKLADEASKQMTSTMLAVADVLTPEQRAKLAEKMEKRRGWMHHE